MIASVTVYEITCDRCGDEIAPPRAQDYWDDLDDVRARAELGDITFTPDLHLCSACTEAEAAAPGGMVDR